MAYKTLLILQNGIIDAILSLIMALAMPFCNELAIILPLSTYFVLPIFLPCFATLFLLTVTFNSSFLSEDAFFFGDIFCDTSPISIPNKDERSLSARI